LHIAVTSIERSQSNALKKKILQTINLSAGS